MTKLAAARLSLGLPIFNGESFLRETLDSILGQTFGDFVLLICDNASTDSTPEICRAYAATDPRVHIFTNDSNRGVGWNHRHVFELSETEYFKWCGADDVIAPDYLSACLGRLERRPDAVLCYSAAVVIDDFGKPVHGEYPTSPSTQLALGSPDVVTRFSNLLSPLYSDTNPFYAVIRSSALRRTRPHGSFLAADRCLLAELSLIGPFLRVPETLFYRRRHAQNATKGNAEEMLLYVPSRSARVSVRDWRVAYEHLAAVRRAAVSPRLKLRLVRAVLRWMVDTRSDLLSEVKELAKEPIRRALLRRPR
jgi:glycosyltransferase involved in cell wall biosynthesis